MKLKRIRWICYALFALALLFCGLMYLHPAFLIGCLAALISLVSVNLFFYRCPHCGRHLGREVGDYCQHCGEELDQG